MAAPWRDEALAEIRQIKPRWAENYGWSPTIEAGDDDADHIDLFVRLCRRWPGQQPADEPPKWYVLRLRYQADFNTAGRREQFVDPDNWTKEGPADWPTGVSGF